MKNLKNMRTLALVFWIIAIVAALFTMPDLNKLAQEKGQISLPSDFESEKANAILKDMDGRSTDTYDFAFVTNSKTDITAAEKKELNAVLEYFKEHKKDYDITSTMFYNDSKQTEKQLVSKDGTTIINQISVAKNTKAASDVANEFEKKLKNLSVKTYITGSDVVQDDFSQTSQEGVQKTEIIAVIFIVIILILIFRSPVIPVVSLLTVGVSYIVSLSIIAQLVKHFDFPFSDFTQVFLVVILFGIGTDYNILLFTRFREELAAKGHVLYAIRDTYKTAGKTVLYSSIAVLLGLSALFFAEFGFYRATGGVAIGVLILVIVLFTLNPFFMGLLGTKLFWPVKKIQSHSDNKFWGFLAKQSFARPFVALLFVALVIVPSILMYSSNLNFNDLTEIDNKYESKQAINIISEHFPAGMSSPTTVVIKSDEKLTAARSLQEIDALTNRLKEIDGIKEVYSVTQPEGKKIKALYLDDQLNELSDSTKDMKKGTADIRQGLASANSPQAAAQQQQALATLPAAVAAQMEQQAQAQSEGLTSATKGLKQIEDGLTSSSDYLTETAKNQASVLNIPDDVLTGKDFKQSIENYMGEDQKTTKLTVILKDNPYTAEAMPVIAEAQKVVHSYMEGSTLHESDAYLAGKTMSNLDLENMSNNDFKRSMIIILIGISIMLLFITRSLSQTVAVIIALVVASFASLGLTEWLTTHLLGVEAMSWNVPFFTFIMLITLGVDYSIFLMMRFREGENNGLEMIVEACKKMGGVILSAAVILGGTFAALIPSGINTLIQVAIAVIIGLVLLAIILMPIFIPSVFSIGQKMNKKK